MWLRDFLPQPRDLHPGLRRLRVMTYGYSSLLRDNKNTTGLDEWSLGLIQSVSAARRSSSVTPPLISLETKEKRILAPKISQPMAASSSVNRLTMESELRNVLVRSYSYVTPWEALSHVRFVRLS